MFKAKEEPFKTGQIRRVLILPRGTRFTARTNRVFQRRFYLNLLSHFTPRLTKHQELRVIVTPYCLITHMEPTIIELTATTPWWLTPPIGAIPCPHSALPIGNVNKHAPLLRRLRLDV